MSVGSYIGAGLAAGWEVGRIEELMRAEFVQRKPVSDWTLPRYALSRGGRIRQATHRVFGDLTAEELPRELTVMATDLYLREAMVLRSGLLREITQASAAVPALLPPVKVDGRIYVDGAVTGNLPVRPLAAECVGPVLAANLAVGGGDGPRNQADLRIPTFGETLMRSLLLSGAGADEAACGWPMSWSRPRPATSGCSSFTRSMPPSSRVGPQVARPSRRWRPCRRTRRGRQPPHRNLSLGLWQARRPE